MSQITAIRLVMVALFRLGICKTCLPRSWSAPGQTDLKNHIVPDFVMVTVDSETATLSPGDAADDNSILEMFNCHEASLRNTQDDWLVLLLSCGTICRCVLVLMQLDRGTCQQTTAVKSLLWTIFDSYLFPSFVMIYRLCSAKKTPETKLNFSGKTP